MSWLRLALALALIATVSRAAVQLIALELVELGSPVALDVAQRWDPKQPEVYYRRGLLRRDSVDHFDLDGACRDLGTAARLNPVNWLYHLELGRCHEARGTLPAAEAAFRRALELNPRSGGDHWSMAHFYLRRERSDTALVHLSRAVALDASLQPAALQLLTSLGIPPDRLTELWPEDRWSRLRLLAHLLQMETANGVTAAAWSVWEELLAKPQSPTAAEATPFLSRLLETDLQAARREWERMTAARSLADPEFSAGTNRIWNGRFLLPPTSGLLDWRTFEKAGVSRQLGEGISLLFDGTANPAGVLLEQLVVVPPDEVLQLSWSACAESLSTDEGIRIAVRQASGAPLTPEVHLTGSLPESRHRIDFQAPPSGRVRVQVFRRPSSRIDSRLSGRLNLNDFQLIPSGAQSHEEMSDLSQLRSRPSLPQ